MICFARVASIIQASSGLIAELLSPFLNFFFHHVIQYSVRSGSVIMSAFVVIYALCNYTV